MPHDLPAVLCNLLHSSTEVPLDKLTEAADEASRGCLGCQWHTEEHCPSSSPVGAALQAAHKDLGKVDFRTPEGLLAGLGYAITRPGHCYQFQQANLASDRSGVSGVHQWSVMLPSARVAQEVYEPLIGIQYPMLCSCKNGRWQIGTGSIRLNEQKPTGLRFVQWIHQDPREATRADPPPESTRAVYLQIESWLAVQAEEPDNILVLTGTVPPASEASVTSPAGIPTSRQQSRLQEQRQSIVLSFMANPAFSVATPTGLTSTKNVTPGQMWPLAEPRT